MPRKHGDASFLWDMLQYARQTRDFVSGRKYEDYLTDPQFRLAVERCVEIIGEAARSVSASFQADHPEIPWSRIISQRHVLAHEYGEIKHDKIWLVATESIPALINLLEPLIPPLPPESPA